MAPGPIHLVTCIGVKSSPHLIAHFLEHYHTLGIGRFLVILHAEKADPRADEAKQLLARWDIRPLREIEEFSAKLKLRHVTEVIREHCEPQTWVVHADVDELQVYPGGLIPYLEDCERRGHAFARGRIVDRLAPGGELIEIRPSPTLWEQFPACARVTQTLIQAWDRKVCAARASVPIADGGAHSVSYGYERRPIWNYRLTHYLPRWRERRIEIHHFKWDATLPQRVREKLDGLGGDLDRWHGAGFLREYRTLDAHLKRFGRISIRGDASYVVNIPS